GDDEARALLRAAFDLGITLLDSAEVYANERELGRLIRSLDNAPDDLVVSTKFGHGKGFSGPQIRQSVEDSLEAFGIERIPLFMLHDPRDDADLAVITGPGGALPELRKLQDEGLVGSIGVATGTLPPLQAAVDSDEFDVIQFPRLYTLLNRAAAVSGLLDRAKERDIGTILTSPFGGNILATGTRGVEQPLYSFWPAQPEVVEATTRIQDAAQHEGLAMPEAAMAFALAEPRIDAIVIGVTNERELRQDVAIADRDVDRDVVERFAEAGAIDGHHLGGPDFVWPFAMDRMPTGLKAKLGL
ncbi:MAG: aldo/keto reductase, partial [Pseudoclavibacter sp.]